MRFRIALVLVLASAATSGKPSAMLRWGGFLDTVLEGVTGAFFDRPQPATVTEEARGRSWRPILAAAMLAAILLVPLAWVDGGYSPPAWGWSALLLAGGAAVGLVQRSRVRSGRLELAMVGLLAIFVGWTVLSTVWSDSVTRSVLEAERSLVYLGALLAALLLVRSRAYRGLVAGVWAAIVLVGLYSLLTRLFPERLGITNAIAGNRLSEPIGYWNGLGLFAALGTLLALGFAARARVTLVRAVTAGSMCVLVPVLYFTFSRGAWLALGAGLLVALALDPRRLQLVTTALVVAPWPVISVALASQADGLTRLDAELAVAASDGRRLALALLVLGVVAALSVVALARAEERVRAGPRPRRAYGAALALLVALLALGAFARFGSPPQLAREAYDAFTAPPQRSTDLNTRLFDLSGGARPAQWRAGWDVSREHPWLGSGAGTYELHWVRERPTPGTVRDAHSLYLETLAELGPVGLALLVAALAVPLVAAIVARRRGLVPPATGAYAAFLAHAAGDWDWELPAVTLAGLLCGAALLVAARSGARARSLSGAPRLAVVGLVVAVLTFAFVGLVGNSAIAAAVEAADDDEPVRAEREARKATRWAPWSSEAWRVLARAQLAQEKRDAAVVTLRKAVRKDPSWWRLWYELALATEGDVSIAISPPVRTSSGNPASARETRRPATAASIASGVVG